MVGITGVVGISGSGRRVSVTGDNYLDVKSHSSDECFAGDYADAQTDTVIITPASGKRIKIIQVYVSTESITSDVALAFGSGAPQFFKLYTAKTQTHTGNLVCAAGAVDETVNLTCPAKTFISIAYDEV